jgi:hypothetical protein
LVTLSFSPVEESSVRLHADVPAGHALEWMSVDLDLGPKARAGKLADVLGSGPDVALLVPNIPGVSFRAEVNAYAGDKNLATASSGAIQVGDAATIALEAAPCFVRRKTAPA